MPERDIRSWLRRKSGLCLLPGYVLRPRGMGPPDVRLVRMPRPPQLPGVGRDVVRPNHLLLGPTSPRLRLVWRLRHRIHVN